MSMHLQYPHSCAHLLAYDFTLQEFVHDTEI